MKYSFTTSLLILFVVLNGYSQSDYREGYIINNSNDTVYGFINFTGSIGNAKKCIFIKDQNNDSGKVVYLPTDIKAYRFINSKYFVSKKIISDSIEKVLFLEYLINGIVGIYYYQDEVSEHYFIEKGDENLVELRNDEAKVYVDGAEYYKKSNQYIGLLKYYFNDGPFAIKEADNVKLTHKSLINIAKDYHNEVCKNRVCIVYEKKSHKVKLSSFGLLLGANYNKIIVNNSGSGHFDYYYLYGSHFDPVYTPSIGLYLKISLPDFDEKLFFQYEATYNKVTYKTMNKYETYNFYNNSMIAWILYNDIAVTLNTLSNVGMIRYEFSKEKFRPVFMIGGFFNYFINTDFSRKVSVATSPGSPVYLYEDKDNPFSNYDFGLTTGLGFIYKFSKKRELSVDLKYQFGFGPLPNLYTNNISLNIGIPIK